MKIATYNVNSINARLDNLLSWLKAAQPDIVLLQEIKSEYASFPFFELRAAGYDAKILGQKSYNGVAILSPHKIRVVAEGLPGFADDNARYLEADITINAQEYKVAAVYAPNGNPPYNNPDDTEKFAYKLRWMEAFYTHAATLLQTRKKVILGGDYNVILTDQDVYDPELFKNNALFRPEVRSRFRALLYQGWYDAYRLLSPDTVAYTYWDYAGAAFNADLGLRIDYLLLSPSAADALQTCVVDKTPRAAEKPSDHTALVATFKE